MATTDPPSLEMRFRTTFRRLCTDYGALGKSGGLRVSVRQIAGHIFTPNNSQVLRGNAPERNYFPRSSDCFFSIAAIKRLWMSLGMVHWLEPL